VNPTLGFNPDKLPGPNCETKSCSQNDAALKLLDYLPLHIAKTEDSGFFNDMNNSYAKDLSQNLHKMNFMVQSALINKVATNKSSFDDKLMGEIQTLFNKGNNKDSENIRNDYEILFKNNGGTTYEEADLTYTLPLKKNVLQFQLSSCSPLKAGDTNIWPYGETYGAVPMGNQIQFMNNKSYCLEDKNGVVVMSNCDESNKNQFWGYDSIDWNLKNDGTQKCLVADGNFRQESTSNDCGGDGGKAGIMVATKVLGPVAMAIGAGVMASGVCDDHTSVSYNNGITLKTATCNPNNTLQDVYMDENGNIKMAPQKLNNDYGFDTFLTTNDDTFSNGKEIYMKEKEGKTSSFYVPGNSINPIPNCDSGFNSFGNNIKKIGEKIKNLVKQ
jgi:hypothetical protein